MQSFLLLALLFDLLADVLQAVVGEHDELLELIETKLLCRCVFRLEDDAARNQVDDLDVLLDRAVLPDDFRDDIPRFQLGWDRRGMKDRGEHQAGQQQMVVK